MNSQNRRIDCKEKPNTRRLPEKMDGLVAIDISGQLRVATWLEIIGITFILEEEEVRREYFECKKCFIIQ